MRRTLYLLLAVLGYLLLSAKSCSDGREQDSASMEVKMIREKAEIRNEFGSDFLPGKSLSAFESKARQKLTDLSDYLNILSDNSMNNSFREQSRQMIVNLFLSDTLRIETRLTNDADSRKITVNEFVQAASQSGSGKFLLDSIRVTEPLHSASNRIYKGRLAFSRRIKNGLARDSAWSPPVSLEAEFFVSKIHKTFGKDTLQIWNLSLGNIE